MLERTSRTPAATLSALFAVALLFGVTAGCGERMPSPSSDAYAEVVTAFHTAVAAIEVGEDRRAEELLLRVVELAPDEAAAWANLGMLALRRNELEVAIDRLRHAQELAPNESRISFLLGLVEATRGNAEEAITHFERARELDPQNVRAIYALAEQLETLRGEAAIEEVRRLVDAILEVQPNNLAVLVERARLDVIAGDSAAFARTMDQLDDVSTNWSTETRDQFASVERSREEGDPTEMITELTFFTNVLKREPAYRESLAAVRTQPGQPSELISTFITLPSPPRRYAERDEGLAFTASPLLANLEGENASWRWVRATMRSASEGPVAVAGREGDIVFDDGVVLEAPGEMTADGFVATDYNYDFQIDVGLAGPNGFRLYRGADDGSFVDVSANVLPPSGVRDAAYAAAWTADVDMDGDLDLILAGVEGPPIVLRNNGDETFSVLDRFGEASSVRGFVWADMDRDGDPDAAFLDASGRVHYFRNDRSEGFSHREMANQVRAITAADLNADGIFELVMLRADGDVVRHQQAVGGMQEVTATIAHWDLAPDAPARLFAMDLDNNGGLDVLASGGGRAAVYLSGADSVFTRTGVELQADVYSVLDMTGDGRLDLVGTADSAIADSAISDSATSDSANSDSATSDSATSAGATSDGAAAVRLDNAGSRDYRSASMLPLAADATGDQRINPFGIGGEIEVRSGLLYQKQPITQPIVHFGLGERNVVEVARIVWPNGDIQAEFDLSASETVETRQRLKGSCPWLFAYNGEGMDFVTDFIWRSPLGLAINAQETAGVMMTEDWVKIEGDELVPRDGVYDLRITAELWETHFFDHVSLMVVDHPEATDIFVDERFAFPPPALDVHVTDEPVPVSRVTDDAGRDVTDLVAAEDERYLATFEKGQYQGVAEEHSIDIDLTDAPSDQPLRLLASGWIRPTDSSINVALAQGSHAPPAGLHVEVPDGRGGWTTVYPNLGFPAGKHKTIVVDLTDVFPAEQVVRLTTNLEIYWDAISWAVARPDVELRTTRLEASRAELRYRGYSAVVEPDRTHPEVPLYDEVASTAQVWQDLEGYYTRFGDVRELLQSIDDRYVIMNAGDELLFEFEAPGDPLPGWTRDYVLIGDGWVKDGDYNTKYSDTVLPLPAHDMPGYDRPRGALEDDPVYRRHADDWREYHTRYVTNDAL